jgi:hypothetical protein
VPPRPEEARRRPSIAAAAPTGGTDTTTTEASLHRTRPASARVVERGAVESENPEGAHLTAVERVARRAPSLTEPRRWRQRSEGARPHSHRRARAALAPSEHRFEEPTLAGAGCYKFPPRAAAAISLHPAAEETAPADVACTAPTPARAQQPRQTHESSAQPSCSHASQPGDEEEVLVVEDSAASSVHVPSPAARSSPERRRPRSSLALGAGERNISGTRVVLTRRPHSAAAVAASSAPTDDAPSATVHKVPSVHSIPSKIDSADDALRASRSLPLLPFARPLPAYLPRSPSLSPPASSSPSRAASPSPPRSRSLSPERPPAAPEPTHHAAAASPLAVSGVGRAATLPVCGATSPVQTQWRVSTVQPGDARGLFLLGRNAQLLHATQHSEPSVRTLAQVTVPPLPLDGPVAWQAGCGWAVCPVLSRPRLHQPSQSHAAVVAV